MSQDAIAQILAFYRDLGVKQIYRRTLPAPQPVSTPQPEPVPQTLLAPQTLPSRDREGAVPTELPGMSPANDTLEKILADIGDCRRCRLCEARHKIVFGSGNPNTKIVFVGEGPGEDEDMQGLPFVGRAGQLLTAMIDNTAKKEGIPITRSDVYICNVVKCRPPKNRTPEPDEMEICGQFLFRQLDVIKPKAICTLGATATKALLAKKEGVTKLRGNWFKWRDIPVMVTYHPSFLLRAYNVEQKREAWEDLKKLFHFVYD
ncbi:MAG: uracil-DNA glycosylase [Bryobacteraceae bacterium]